jgi:diguanylate cyclase (GGDEF)-like protein
MGKDISLDMVLRLTRAAQSVALRKKGAADTLTELTDTTQIPKEIADLAEQINTIVVQKEISEFRLETMVEDLLASQAELVEAKHDSLTGLPNRALFHEKLNKECEAVETKDSGVALLFIDLDKFKQVNDTMGHDAGDELLIDVSKRIQASTRTGDVVARLGGDEFTVILPVADEKEVVRVATRIVEELNKPFPLTAGIANIGGSIGISFYPAEADSPISLVKNADIAVYKAKERGRNNFQFYRDL